MESLEPELRRLVSDHPVARLATVRPDGHPHLVPVTFALDGERIVTVIDHKPKTTSALQRLKNIEAHPAASVMIDHYEEDWSRLWWVRADGAARIVAEGAAREHAVGRLVDKYRHYQQKAPLGPVIELGVTRWTWWSASPRNMPSPG